MSRANEDSARHLAEAVVHRDKAAVWNRTATQLAEASAARYRVLEVAAGATMGLMHPSGANLHARGTCQAWRPSWHPFVEEMPEDVDVEQVIAGFSGHADAIVGVVSVEQVIEDAPRQG